MRWIAAILVVIGGAAVAWLAVAEPHEHYMIVRCDVYINDDRPASPDADPFEWGVSEFQRGYMTSYIDYLGLSAEAAEKVLNLARSICAADRSAPLRVVLDAAIHAVTRGAVN